MLCCMLTVWLTRSPLCSSLCQKPWLSSASQDALSWCLEEEFPPVGPRISLTLSSWAASSVLAVSEGGFYVWNWIGCFKPQRL